jgi:hypothetical protein
MKSRRLTLSEDWQATLVGLAIVAVIGLGLIGPGPQTVTLTAAPGAAAEAAAPAAAGWKTSAALGGDSVPVAGAVVTLMAGSVYEFACRDGAVALETRADDAGQPQLALTNDCAADAVVTLKRDNAIPWPVFGLLAR